MSGDVVNGLFEFSGALFMGLNVRQLLRDRQVKGVHWLSMLFFTSWGYWNLFYYPSLGQTWSFLAGACLAAMNSAWATLTVFYLLRQRNQAYLAQCTGDGIYVVNE